MSLHTYVIERELPGAGELTEAELHTIATKSNAVIADMNSSRGSSGSRATSSPTRSIASTGPWTPTSLRDHAGCGGFPANVVSEVKSFFDPTTGD